MSDCGCSIIFSQDGIATHVYPCPKHEEREEGPEVLVETNILAGQEICRTCGDRYETAGDGWDGECPVCADKSKEKNND